MRARRFHVKRLSGEEFVYIDARASSPEDPSRSKRVTSLLILERLVVHCLKALLMSWSYRKEVSWMLAWLWTLG